MKRTLLFISLSLLMANLMAQTGIVFGTISNSEGAPIEFVNVSFEGTTKGGTTDKEGKFRIENVTSGEYTIVASSIGYETARKSISISSGQTLELNFQLSENDVELQTVEITGRRAIAYDNEISYAATKVATPIKDIPQAISYVTKEVMADRQAYRVNDVVKNISGVNQFSYYNDFTMRGFRSDIELVNGLRVPRLFGPQTIIPYLERVEVIKGPASALFGNTNPGGTMNRVTKKPLDAERKAISFTTGSFNTFRSTLDFTGPLNQSKTLLYRLNIAYENSDDFRDLQEFKSTVIAPSISFLPTEKTRLNFDLVLQRFDGKLDRGQPIFGATAGTDLNSTPISFALNQPTDYHRANANFATLSLSHELSKSITFNASYMKYVYEEDLFEHRTSNRFAVDGTGQPIPTLMEMQILNRQTENINDNLTTYFSIETKTGDLEHRIVVGYDFISREFPNGNVQRSARGYRLQGGGASINPADFPKFEFDANGNPVPNVPHFDLTNANYVFPNTENYVYTQLGFLNSKFYTNGIYIQDQLKFGKLQALVSLRQEFYTDLINFDRPNEEEVEQNKLLPRFGLVYSATNNINLYATYTESFQPQRATVVNNPLLGGPFDPTFASMIEGGAKGTFFNNRLSANLAIYHIENNNILINANDPGNPDLLEQRGQEQSRGFEIDINGAIGVDLSITANYAYNIAEITGSDDETQIGLIKENAPRHSGGLFANYGFSGNFLNGLNLNIGTNFVSERNTFERELQLPGYMIWDAGASYKVNKVKLALTLNNLFDETHWVGGYSYVRLFPGAPRNWLLSVSYTF